MVRKVLGGFLFFAIIFANCPVHAEKQPVTAAGKTVISTVDIVRQTVTASANKLAAAELDEKLKSIIYPVFNFDEMSKRCLGAYWPKTPPEKRQEFVSLFSDLLARNYLKKIRDNVAKSEVTLVEDSAQDGKAMVRTIVSSEGQSAAIDYRLRDENGAWRIYDVVIENIGLVSNYRSEFAGIIERSGFDGLLAKLREKNAAAEAK